MLALAHDLESESLCRSRRRMRRRAHDVRSAIGIEELRDRNDARSFLLPRLEAAQCIDEGVAFGRGRVWRCPLAERGRGASQERCGGAQEGDAVCVERSLPELERPYDLLRSGHDVAERCDVLDAGDATQRAN